jgi:hypothetical protein
MNTNTTLRRIIGRTTCFLLGGLFLGAAHLTTAVAEETFPVIQIGTKTYTNVTVTTKAKKYIFIMHSAGMANIKIEDLSPELQEELGYAASGAKPKGTGGAVAAWAKEKMALVQVPQVRAAEQRLQDTWRERAATQLPKLRSANPMLIYAALGAMLLGYLFFCYCAKLICDKTGNPPGILVWLPLLQMFPLLRAAGMSPLWFLAYLVPVLNIVAQIVWSSKIAKARGKSVWAGICLLLPITSFFAFLYLAFSDGGLEKEEPEVRVMCLETA